MNIVRHTSEEEQADPGLGCRGFGVEGVSPGQGRSIVNLDMKILILQVSQVSHDGNDDHFQLQYINVALKLIKAEMLVRRPQPMRKTHICEQIATSQSERSICDQVPARGLRVPLDERKRAGSHQSIRQTGL
jgi:hypothetical protein